MIIRSAPERPMKLAIGCVDWQIIDARKAPLHQTVLSKLPVLIAIGAKPIPGLVVPLIRKADGDAVVEKGPEFFDEPVFQLARPLTGQEGDDLLPPICELGAIAPS